MEKFKKRENLVLVVLELVIQLVGTGILIPIISLTSRSPKSRDDNMAINGYFRIAGVENLVWLHVQHGYGVFINEYITTRQGNKINLVEQLSKYYYYYRNFKSQLPTGYKIQGCIIIYNLLDESKTFVFFYYKLQPYHR